MKMLIRSTLLASALVTMASVSATAQAGPRWQAYVGCWTAAPSERSALDFNVAPSVCITRTSGEMVEFATVTGGKIVSRDTVDGSGAEHPITTKDCSGTQRAKWSSDERRLFLKSAVTCGTVTTMTSGIIAMTPSGEWLDVRGMSAGGGDNVRVARYRSIPVPPAVATELSAAASRNVAGSEGAQIAAGAAIGTNAVIEATSVVDVAVVEAWLLERGQQFDLDAKTLVSLADAGVSERITDAMVAVSNPKQFAFARKNSARVDYDDAEVTGRRVIVQMEPAYGWGRRYGYGYDGYGYGYGYGYSPYDYYGYGRGYGTGYYNQPIVVVVPGGNNSGSSNGQVVKGRGYRQGSESSSTGSSARSTSPSSSSGSSSSSSSSGSSQSAPAPAPAQSETRTAKPRP